MSASLPDNDLPGAGVDRRTMLRAAVWAVPAIVVVRAAPAHAASGDPTAPPPAPVQWTENSQSTTLRVSGVHAYQSQSLKINVQYYVNNDTSRTTAQTAYTGFIVRPTGSSTASYTSATRTLTFTASGNYQQFEIADQATVASAGSYDVWVWVRDGAGNLYTTSITGKTIQQW